MVRVKRASSLLAVALLCGSGHALATPACTDLLPGTTEPVHRALVAEDLVRLRDIGPIDPLGQDGRILALSPDGKHVAFQLRQADPQRNSYCLAMVVASVSPGAAVRVVDSGGELIRATYDFREKAGFPTGTPQMIMPIWAPNGRWFAYLRRDEGTTQVWRANADGSGSKPLTHSEEDVEDFQITADGRTLVFSFRPLRAARIAIEREGLSGFRYDARYAPSASTRPFPAAPVENVIMAMDLSSGVLRQTSSAERTRLRHGSAGQGKWVEARDPRRGRAWLDTSVSSVWPGRGRLVVDAADRRRLICQADACAGASWPWWTTDGHVRFFKREGWGDASTAIYDWRPGTDGPRRLYVTDDVLADCVPDDSQLICLREGSLTPRRLERLDPANGGRTLLFDPNPEFAVLDLGKVERLHITNSFGLQSVADLVLPVGYQPGKRYPLVVVQYNTRGFLRGGTGDDYPIQAFANRGYAVLSVSRPKAVGFLTTTNFDEVERLNIKDFADRRSVLSAVELGVQQAIDKAIVDPGRIGITGMSDGAATAAFALLHSKLFSAAAMSQCCYDAGLLARVGPAAARSFQYFGYPGITDRSQPAQDFWRKIALSWNAQAMRTPILLQLADDEYMSALETFTALREADAPIDMYVFPNEHHVKWQPAHRLAQYRRTLDWFDYWLKAERSPTVGNADQLSHWDALRRAQSSRDGA